MRSEMTTLPSARKIFEKYRLVKKEENILLIGTVGAGKSATVNTITAALSGEKKYRAPIGSLHGESGRRTTTHLIWFNKCGIDGLRQKDLRVPKSFPNLVDMTGLSDEYSKEQEELLEMIIMGRIPNQTSIPALQDVQKKKGGSKTLRRWFPFVVNGRRIHKILFIASATEPVPKELIRCVKNVSQPDGSSSNLNPRYIPIFGLLTKPDMVDVQDAEFQRREKEFLECLGIDSNAAYSQWQNSSTGDFTSGVLYFLDKLLAPDVRYVLDEISCLNILGGKMWENPVYGTAYIIIFTAFCFSIFKLYQVCDIYDII